MRASLRQSRWFVLSTVAAGLLVGGAYAAEGPATTATTSATLSTTLHLALSTTATKEVSVRLGQSAQEILARCQPAKPGADDDPILYYAAAGGGMYMLFFPPSDTQALPDLRRDALAAAAKYADPDEKDGVYLLPEAMRGKACGEHCTLKVPFALDPGKTRTAFVTLGMSQTDVMRLFEAARNYSDRSDLVLLRSSDGGRYLLVFAGDRVDIGIASPRDGLAEVLYRPGDAKEGRFLFPRSKRGSPVPAAHAALLASPDLEPKDPAPGPSDAKPSRP